MWIRRLGFDEIKERAEKLRNIAEEKLRNIAERFSVEFSLNISQEVSDFLRDNPLAPIIGTICDQQINCVDAWTFPYWLNEKLKNQKDFTFTATSIRDLGEDRIREMLETFMNEKDRNGKDRWPQGMGIEERQEYLTRMSQYIIDVCNLISEEYNNNPDRMFIRNNNNNTYSVPEIYFILRTLPGIGPKKASMIARDFANETGQWYEGLIRRNPERFRVTKKEFSEVPVDIHVVKVFGRLMGEFRKFRNIPYPDIQNFAKIAFPDFPGKMDEILWSVGRNYCHEWQPDCNNCPLNEICEYWNIVCKRK